MRGLTFVQILPQRLLNQQFLTFSSLCWNCILQRRVTMSILFFKRHCLVFIVSKLYFFMFLAQLCIYIFGFCFHIQANIVRPITCFSYILMISIDRQNKMANYLINPPFHSDDFIRCYEIIRNQKSRYVIDLNVLAQ